MGLSSVITYSIALGIAALIPGPGMTALVARSISGGFVSGFSLLGGLIMGDLIYLSFAVFGLVLVTEYFESFFLVVKIVASLYLCYLAYIFWVTKSESIQIKTSVTKKDMLGSAVSGFIITMSNPKTIAFYLALLPLVLDLESISLHNWSFILVPTTITVLLLIGGIYVFGAVAARHFLARGSSMNAINKGASVIMFGAAAMIFLRQ